MAVDKEVKKPNPSETEEKTKDKKGKANEAKEAELVSSLIRWLTPRMRTRPGLAVVVTFDKLLILTYII